jgi:16S rRNA (guanine527-N7)-methyltransferase
MPKTDDQIRSLLAPFKVDLDPGQIVSVRKFLDLLELWNRRISLVSPADMDQLIERHVGESLFASSAVPIRHGRLADVGTGAGFPGIPLKIAHPSLDLTLIESNQRKSAFLSEAARSLHFDSCQIVTSRYEDFMSTVGFNFICCRAVGEYENMLKWARSRLAVAGQMVLWLGMDDAIQLSKAAGWKWRDVLPIPNSSRRVLLVGSPDSYRDAAN